MANQNFYSPDWVRRLVKEDAQSIVDYVSKKDKHGNYTNDFRSYIDARMPFVLWLSIWEIEKKVLEPMKPSLQLFFTDNFNLKGKKLNQAVDTLYGILLNAYKDLINSYIDNKFYEKVDSAKELEIRLSALQDTNINVRDAIKTYFSKTFIVTSLSKSDQSVMLVLPNYKLISSRFGSDYKNLLDFSAFAKKGEDPENLDSMARQVKDLLFGSGGGISSKKLDFFQQLQNIGHIEVDVKSDEEDGSTKIKRGQNSPRLLQALLSVPKNTNAVNKLQAQFSKETLQAESRVIIRKKFSGSKMIFEMLVENGMSVGIPESQAFNLIKAAKEASFSTGKGFTEQIRKNPNILFDLETSKSIKQYTFANLKEMLSKGKNLPTYTSNTIIKGVAQGSIPKVKLKLPNVSTNNGTKRSTTKFTEQNIQTTNLSSLQNLLDTHLQDVVSANMGSGGSTDILNYRTGRLAASAKVERLSESREGMITAFYSYMQNPYATFSEGGRQSIPRSRDPKLLISKSIKEIAAEKVANRMRTVLV